MRAVVNPAQSQVYLWVGMVLLLLLALLPAGDWPLASWLYQLGGEGWQWRHAGWSQFWLHDVLRVPLQLAVLLLWGLTLACYLPWVRRWVCRYLPGGPSALRYLSLSLMLSALLVQWGKHSLGVDCPWDLQGLGGVRLPHEWWQPLPVGQEPGQCFPAGHASLGYMWLGLYFVLAHYRPQWRYPALGLIIALALVLGAVQQLRGAHFLSHDVATAALCWWVAWGLARLWRWPSVGQGMSHD